MGEIKELSFREINIDDIFFDSLKENYSEFNKWFYGKSCKNEKAFILDENGIQAFLYLKEEDDVDEHIEPRLPMGKKLKVGTFKVNPHGTKLGERFIKLIFDKMLQENIFFSYVTIFDEHEELISLLQEYGFSYWGIKSSVNGEEKVFVKNFREIGTDFKKNYPLFNIEEGNKYLLSIYPKFHTELFPDSQLRTEKNHIIKDMSPTNCIEKIYLAKMLKIADFSVGDKIVIYRTAEDGKKAWFNSVATSICTIVDIKNINNFSNYSEFLEYVKRGTIFSLEDLEEFWRTKKYPYIIKMLYNVALTKRITNGSLINDVGMDPYDYWGVRELTEEQFDMILELGKINENILIK